MPRSEFSLLAGELVSITDALKAVRDRRVAGGGKLQFRCVDCGDPVKPHEASQAAAAHFEHLRRNPRCKLSDPERGAVVGTPKTTTGRADRSVAPPEKAGSTSHGNFSSWHVGVAAEAFAAGLFARCGLNVSVQYGADQPEYDLVVGRADKMLKVSVKGSKDGSWGLTQSYLADANYHAAVESWLRRHSPRTILCFVQFKNVALDAMPRVYVATPQEVASRLKATAKGRGDTILYEKHAWSSRAVAAGAVEEIPTQWRFSADRMTALLEMS